MKYAISALVLAAACAFPSSLRAQAKPTDIYVSVLDGKGEPATGLAATDFRVREDGVTREVLKAGPATEPLTVALLVDDSAVLGQGTQMIREAVDAFIADLAGKAEMTLVTYGERPTIQVDYTTDTKKLQDGARRIFPRPGSGGYLLDALVDVSRGLEKRKAKRPVIAVLMLEDDVEFSNRHYDNVLNELARGGGALHVIAMGQPNSKLTDGIRNRNQTIAVGTERSGGRRDNVLALTGATPRMKQLAAELLNQYVVTYARPETLIPPDKIEVTVAKPGLTVRARTRTGAAGVK